MTRGEPTLGEGQERSHWAFISYSHTDRKVARWLHRQLESFRVPAGLTSGGDGHGRLHPVFMDREDLPSGPDLPAAIRAAVARSRSMVVVCTPRAARSRWIQAEVEEFVRIGRARRIFCLVVEGEPLASVRPDTDAPECLPQMLIPELSNGPLLAPSAAGPTGRATPLAADMRSGRDGKKAAVLKLAAGILSVDVGLPYDRVRARRLRSLARRALLVVASRPGRRADAARASLSVSWRCRRSPTQRERRCCRPPPGRL